jgi:hypothetical protein
MGILDDAIREHLDLKRRHGARETELREIEDEAFGSTDQPDPFVGGEIYGEVGSSEPAEAGNEEPTRLVEAEALRPSEPAPEPELRSEAEPTSEPDLPIPPAPSQEPEALLRTEQPAEPEPDTTDQSIGGEPASEAPGQVELPGQEEIPGQERLDAEPDAPAPSESLEELIAEEEPFPEDTAAPPAPPPADTEREPEPESRPLEPEPEAQAPPEPEPSVPDPPPPPPEPGAEPPGRARGRVDVPTQEHPPPGDTGDLPPLPGDEAELGRPDTTYQPPPPMEPPSDEAPLPAEPPSDEAPLPAEPPSDEEQLPDQGAAAGSDGPQLYDFETDEDSVPPPGGSEPEDDFEALGPAEEEAPYLDEEEPYPDEPGTAVRPAVEEEEPRERRSSDTEERLVEEEEGEEGLWFEKGPPKDFDFDD